ncbi:hypothetical protein WUBG_11190, partial [Wuchereria bancrofti]
MALANMELCTSSKNNSNVARSTGSTALSDNQTVLPSYQGNQSLELSLLMGVNCCFYITGYIFVFESTNT